MRILNSSSAGYLEIFFPLQRRAKHEFAILDVELSIRNVFINDQQVF